MSERLLGVAFVGVGYSSPPMTFNQAGVEAANNATLETLGYPAFGYWYFMNDEKVAPILDVYVSPGQSRFEWQDDLTRVDRLCVHTYLHERLRVFQALLFTSWRIPKVALVWGHRSVARAPRQQGQGDL